MNDEVRQVVFLAGGTGERFKKFSMSSKPLIRVLGSSQIDWAIKGAALSYPGSRFFIAARSELLNDLEDSIESAFPGFITEFVDIGDSTSGAAESLYRFLKLSRKVCLSAPLVSCDNDCFNFIDGSPEGNFLSYIKSNNPGHCYIQADEEAYAVKLYEKSMVSSIAISGHYGFVHADLFMRYYLNSCYSQKEKFISDVISEMLNDGIKFKLKFATEYFSLGTPEEINNLNKRILDFG